MWHRGNGEKHRKHEGLSGIPGDDAHICPGFAFMQFSGKEGKGQQSQDTIPGLAVQVPGFHSTVCLCKMQDLWELFGRLLNSSSLNEPVSLVQKQGQCLGGYRRQVFGLG